MKKKNTIPKEFDDVLGNIYSNTMSQEETTHITEDMLMSQTEIEEDDNNEPPVTKDAQKQTTEDGENGGAKEDDSDIPAEVLQQMQGQTTQVDNEDNVEDTEPSNADVNEAQQVGLLFDAVGESLGWNMADIEDEDRPLTVDDLTTYLSNVVKENSVPQYADERVQMLDEYIKNGGRFEDFYAAQQQRLSFDNLDMDDEANQKAIVRELLKHDGYSDEQINKRIARYEDADMLLEESEDALDRLKSIRQKEIEENAKAQEEYARQQEEQSKAFYDSVSNSIKSLTNIRGIAIPKEDRQALFDYIFKVDKDDKDGYSQYQKDFNANLSKNLIESAYFTMKADTIINGAKQQGETSAAEKLRKMLRHSSKNHTSYNADERKQKSVVDLATGLF